MSHITFTCNTTVRSVEPLFEVDTFTSGTKTMHMMDSLTMWTDTYLVTNDTGVVLLVERLLPAGLIAVTLHTYWSHSDEPALVVMLSLLIVMVVEEVLNIVMVVVLVLLVLVSRTVTV